MKFVSVESRIINISIL